jgi:hypothetical protein
LQRNVRYVPKADIAPRYARHPEKEKGPRGEGQPKFREEKPEASRKQVSVLS